MGDKLLVLPDDLFVLPYLLFQESDLFRLGDEQCLHLAQVVFVELHHELDELVDLRVLASHEAVYVLPELLLARLFWLLHR